MRRRKSFKRRTSRKVYKKRNNKRIKTYSPSRGGIRI